MAKRSPRASTEIATYDREAKTVELRAAGYSFAAIASELGFADASGASKAFSRALKRRPAQNVDEIRAQEASRLEYLWERTARVIESPPLAHSAIGRTIPDPRHEGEYLIDESARIRAMHEYRLQSESYRKLTGADLTVRQPSAEEEADYREAVEYVQQLQAENCALRARVTELERGPVVRAEVLIPGAPSAL